MRVTVALYFAPGSLDRPKMTPGSNVHEVYERIVGSGTEGMTRQALVEASGLSHGQVHSVLSRLHRRNSLTIVFPEFERTVSFVAKRAVRLIRSREVDQVDKLIGWYAKRFDDSKASEIVTAIADMIEADPVVYYGEKPKVFLRAIHSYLSLLFTRYDVNAKSLYEADRGLVSTKVGAEVIDLCRFRVTPRMAL